MSAHLVGLSPARRRASLTAGRAYRIERLSMSLLVRDMYFRQHDPRPGDAIPAFDLPLLDGGRFSSHDLLCPRPTLVVFGSLTCPVTDDAAPGLRALQHAFGRAVRFVLVYTREAHPGARVPQPHTPAAKRANAERLRQLHEFDFEVAIDDIDGSLHRAMSPKPNSAYLVGTDGRILFRAQWANDTPSLHEALAAVTTRGSLDRTESAGIVRPMLRMLRHISPVLDRAGAGAWADMWRVALPLAALAQLLSLIGVRPSPSSSQRSA